MPVCWLLNLPVAAMNGVVTVVNVTTVILDRMVTRNAVVINDCPSSVSIGARVIICMHVYLPSRVVLRLKCYYTMCFYF